MRRAKPDVYTANMRKAVREGRVFVDHLRNGRGNTAIAAYSVRKKPRAPVSVPITWDEVDDVTPNGWTMLSLVERVSSTPDPWAAFLDVKQALPKMKKKRR